MSERSYCVRSAVATNASASFSVLRTGNFFFIIFDLLWVHVTGADGPNEVLLPMSAQGKDGKNATPDLGPADGDEPRFAMRMPGIGGTQTNPLWEAGQPRSPQEKRRACGICSDYRDPIQTRQSA